MKRTKKVIDKGGAPLGNRNAAKGTGVTRDAFLAVRCLPGDKSDWVRAANRAKQAGKLPGFAQSVLADWAIVMLNEAAEKEAGAKRKG